MILVKDKIGNLVWSELMEALETDESLEALDVLEPGNLLSKD